MNIHAALEGLIDRFHEWQDRRFRARLRRRLRKDRTFYLEKAPAPRCVVRNMREPNK